MLVTFNGNERWLKLLAWKAGASCLLFFYFNVLMELFVEEKHREKPQSLSSISRKLVDYLKLMQLLPIIDFT